MQLEGVIGIWFIPAVGRRPQKTPTFSFKACGMAGEEELYSRRWLTLAVSRKVINGKNRLTKCL
jgi:hypothetical protein